MSFASGLRRSIGLAVLIPFCSALAALAGDAPPASASGISVSIDVVRTDAAKGTFLCTAQVSDLLSGEILAAPTIAFTAESGAKARSGSQPDVKKPASEVVLEVSVSKAGDSASYAVSYTREGVLVARQKGSLTLR
jgi:hypothetical protein